MLIQVCRYTGSHTRNILRTGLGTAVEVDEFPDDRMDFAVLHGGECLQSATGMQAA
jgi:hypothetical protein